MCLSHADRGFRLCRAAGWLLLLCAATGAAGEKDPSGGGDNNDGIRPVAPGLFASARALEQKGGERLGEALAIYRAALRNGARGTTAEAATMGVARCEIARGNLMTAFEVLEESFPAQYDAAAVDRRIRLEAVIAERLLREKKYEEAARVLGAIVYNDPRYELAPVALMKKGDCYLELARYGKAEQVFRLVLRNYPNAPQAVEAGPALAQALALKPYEKDEIPQKARAEIADLLRRAQLHAPQTPALKARIEAARRARARAEAEGLLKKARFYLDLKTKPGRRSAAFLLRDIIERYPETEAAGTAVKLLQTLQPT